MKETVRKESYTAQLDDIRMIILIVTFILIGIVDISGAYIKSGPIRRHVLARPPRERDKEKGISMEAVENTIRNN